LCPIHSFQTHPIPPTCSYMCFSKQLIPILLSTWFHCQQWRIMHAVLPFQSLSNNGCSDS
jgi:hypothetical protein